MGIDPRCILRALLSFCSLALVSCGSDGRLPVYPVTGSVFYDGKPAAGAVVTFHKAGTDDKSILPNGKVQKDGTFELTTYEMDDGVPEGEYNVVIYWEKKPPKREPSSGGDDDDPATQLLPARYLRPQTSGISVKITKATTELEPFRLTR
jgi:hypothetical protein